VGAAQETRVEIETHPDKIDQWLDTLMDSSGVFIRGEASDTPVFPAVLLATSGRNSLLLDCDSAPFLDGGFSLPGDSVEAGAEQTTSVVLFAVRGNAKITLPPLAVIETSRIDGKICATLAYPREARIEFRRSDFRAVLRRELKCRVVVNNQSQVSGLAGELKDLSARGCQLLLPLSAAKLLSIRAGAYQLTLEFPSGESLAVEASLRHFTVEPGENVIYAGFQFGIVSPAQIRRLWYYVREIEREFARNAQLGRELKPSPLFESSGAAASAEPERGKDYATPMARLLARIGDYVAAQALLLQRGQQIDGAQLSRQTDQLLSLLDQDRQELCFAIICLDDQSPLVSHCLNVAVLLADVVTQLRMPRATVKAIAACALIHDLGKAILGVQQQRLASPLKAGDEAARQVELLLTRMGQCRWIRGEVQRDVIGQINERLDGSGHPQGLVAGQLSELAKLAAVVDAIDCARRGPNGEHTSSFREVRSLLSGQKGQLEEKWLQHCLGHLGHLPVGALVHSADGRQGWGRRVDANGTCTAWVPVKNKSRPSTADVANELAARELKAMGALREIASQETAT